MADWILTYTGARFAPLEPNANDIDIIDIAHALSNMCRFTGHCREFYSVAQHSVLVAEYLWKRHYLKGLALTGLLHDASEAYLVDVARPVKHSAEFSFYREIEGKLQTVIYNKFGIFHEPDAVKHADNHLLDVEAYFLMPDCEDWESTTEKPEGFTEFPCWSPQKSKDKFLSAFLDFGCVRG